MLVTKVIDLNAPLTPEQEAELDALSKMSDDDIVFDEVPETYRRATQEIQARKSAPQGKGGKLILN